MAAALEYHLCSMLPPVTALSTAVITDDGSAPASAASQTRHCTTVESRTLSARPSNGSHGVVSSSSNITAVVNDGIASAITEEVVTENGKVVLHLGVLFVGAARRCNLRRHLAAPPERNGRDMILRLSNRDWILMKHLTESQAVGFEARCREIWDRRRPLGESPQGTAAANNRMATPTQQQDVACDEVRRELSPAEAGLTANRAERILNLADLRGLPSPAPGTPPAARENRSRSPRRVAPPAGFLTPRRAIRRRSTNELSPSRTPRSGSRTLLASASPAHRGIGSNPENGQSAASRSPFAVLEQVVRSEHKRARALSAPERERRLLRRLQSDESCNVRASPQSLGPRTPDVLARDSTGLHLCVVCQEHIRQLVFMPCKHLVCCADCGADPAAVASASTGAVASPGISRCPVCRAEVEWRLAVYL